MSEEISNNEKLLIACADADWPETADIPEGMMALVSRPQKFDQYRELMKSPDPVVRAYARKKRRKETWLGRSGWGA